jgi:hypothetical protein
MMTPQVKPAYRKPGKPQGSTQADRVNRTIRANFIEARGSNIPQIQAGYMEAILSLSLVSRNLAKWEETIYAACRTEAFQQRAARARHWVYPF